LALVFLFGNVCFRRWLQPVSATLYLFTKRWSVGNGLSDTDQVHSGPEGRYLGSLAAR
jgi:hypothetical protein